MSNEIMCCNESQKSLSQQNLRFADKYLHLYCPNKEYNVVFKNFHQNIRAFPKSKKICIDQ